MMKDDQHRSELTGEGGGGGANAGLVHDQPGTLQPEVGQGQLWEIRGRGA
jgi:hypothetical protein